MYLAPPGEQLAIAMRCIKMTPNHKYFSATQF